MLAPKKTKYRKAQCGRNRGRATRGCTLAFGEFGLQLLEPGWISQRQIEAARVAMTRYIKRGGNIFIRMFPDKPVTSKPAETRMGKGKGALDGYVYRGQPGRILYEIAGIADPKVVTRAFQLAQYKLSLRTRIISLKDQL
jgi:large subunit ribosomal protein L16